VAHARRIAEDYRIGRHRKGKEAILYDKNYNDDRSLYTVTSLFHPHHTLLSADTYTEPNMIIFGYCFSKI
jgi:hypothetical protein